jgi:predicted phosphodiesterase
LLKDFEIIIHEFEENNDITIIPISDVHLGANEHMQRVWETFCMDVLKEPNTYITLGGDLINNATRNSVSNIFEETMRPSEQKRLMAKMLEPLRGRILCAVSGNHERRSMKDADDEPTYDIMCKLDLEHLYRENLAFVKLRIGDQKGNGQTNPTYTLAVTHGSGGGAMTGGTVNRNERFGYAIEGIDALVVGHSHKPLITQPAKLVVDHANNKISVKPFKVVVSTAWLGYGGYAAQKMLIPSSHSVQKICLAGKHKELTVTM